MRPEENVIIAGLRETYHELGVFELKFCLNPKLYSGAHGSCLTLYDSRGRQIDFDLKYWGKKAICLFKIDEKVSDGVAVGNFFFPASDSGRELNKRFTFWVIK